MNLQREIAQAVDSEVGAKAAGAQPLRLARRSPVDPEAYDLYLRGKSLANRRIRAENQEAMELLEQAVAKDRGFAPAYATLALAYIERFFTFAPEERHLAEQARAAIETAISLDPDLCDAYVARGRLLWSPSSGFSFEKAIRDFRRAAALNPRSVQAHWWLGAVYGHIGLLEEGFQEAQMATELNPIGAMPPNHLVEPLLWQGKYEQALEFLRSSPHEGDTSLHGSKIAWALFQLGRIKEARVTVDQYLRDSPEDMGGQLKGLQALLLAAAGEERKAAEKIKEAIQRQGTGQFHHTAYYIACTYARMNDPERAVLWLKYAAENGFPCYPLFALDRSLEAVRQDPRFVEFMAKTKRQWEHQKAHALM